MSKHYQMPFSPNYRFVCVKPFVMSGRAYERGDEVDTSEIETRRLRQMYEARMVDGVAPEQEPLAASTKAPKAVAVEPPTGPQEAASGGLSMVHKGFSRYYVVDGSGNEVAGPVTKEEATRLVAAG
jgi:hypothetical protein